jgi:hypothetical protein
MNEIFATSPSQGQLVHELNGFKECVLKYSSSLLFETCPS